MNTLTQKIEPAKNFGTPGQNIASTAKLNACRTQAAEISWIAALIEKIIEVVLAITIGAAIGWYGGKIAGGVCASYFQPPHLPNTQEVMRWWMMPWAFAKEGILIGAVGGILAIFMIEYRISVKKACH
jgi:hypothetical protein